MKKLISLTFFVIFIFFVIVAAIVPFFLRELETLEVKEFDVNEYLFFIESFPSNETIGNTSNLGDVIAQVEEIWVELYGESVKNEKPYEVFYDADKGVWLIRGSLPAHRLGGVANLLLDKRSGEVLAVWHEE